MKMIKHIALATLVLGTAAGCASQPTTQEEPEPMETADTGMDSYVVVRGDNLWDISGKSEIYGNPYQWPLIYKANRDKIDDADLIYPGQSLDITRDNSQADIDAAVRHAKTRGAWSVGAVEDSDRRYLSE